MAIIALFLTVKDENPRTGRRRGGDENRKTRRNDGGRGNRSLVNGDDAEKLGKIVRSNYSGVKMFSGWAVLITVRDVAERPGEWNDTRMTTTPVYRRVGAFFPFAPTVSFGR